MALPVYNSPFREEPFAAPSAEARLQNASVILLSPNAPIEPQYTHPIDCAMLGPGADFSEALTQTAESALEQHYSSNSTRTFVLDPANYPEVFAGAVADHRASGFGAALPPSLPPFDSGTQLDSAELDAYESLLLDAACGGDAAAGGLGSVSQGRDLRTPVLVDFAHTSQEWPDVDAAMCSTGTQTHLRAHPQLWPIAPAALTASPTIGGPLTADMHLGPAAIAGTTFMEPLLPPLADSSTQTSRELIELLNSFF